MGRASRAASGGQAIDNAGTLVSWPDLVRKMTKAMDPFGALRTVEYQPIFSSQPVGEVSVLTDRPITTGSAAITVEAGEYKLTNPGGETCRLESGERGRYQAGIVGVPGLGVRRTTQPSGTTVYRMGYFDDDRGFGLKEDANGLATFVLNGGAEVHERRREDWIDPLDGTGPSGRTYVLLDGHILSLPFLWYGYGTLTMGVVVPGGSSEIDDELVIVDRYTPSGGLSLVNPNLPVTASIEGDSPGELFVGGRQYGVYGNIGLRRRVVGERRVGQALTTTLIPMISSRIRNIDPWRSIPIQVEGISLITDVSLDWVILIGATLTSGGSALTDNDWNTSQFSQGDTSAEFNINADALSGGEIVSGPRFVRGGSGTNIGGRSADIPAQDIPVGEPVTLAAVAHSGTGTVRSALRMAELR